MSELPARSAFIVSQTLQLKSSYPARRRRPLLEKATDVMPQMMLSWLYMASSWSARMSKRRQVASSEPVAKANPFGKNVTALMSLSWPGNVCLHCPSRMSHSLAEASQAPLTKARHCGDRDKAITSPVCPRKEVTCWPVSMSHRPHDMSPELVTICTR